MADDKEQAAARMVPVEYLVDFNEFKAGDKAKLDVSEAWRMSWRGIVRQTNTQK